MGAWGISGPRLGPAAPVVESVFGSVAGAVGQGPAVPGAVRSAGMDTALAGMQNAFSGLFGRTQGYLPACPLQPPAFATGAIPADIQQNPPAYLQGVVKPLNQLQGVLQSLPAPQPAAMPATAPASPLGSGDFSYLDGMEAQIESLMSSDKVSDQLQAQMLMNQFSQRVATITSMLAKLDELMTKIAQNMAQ